MWPHTHRHTHTLALCAGLELEGRSKRCFSCVIQFLSFFLPYFSNSDIHLQLEMTFERGNPLNLQKSSLRNVSLDDDVSASLAVAVKARKISKLTHLSQTPDLHAWKVKSSSPQRKSHVECRITLRAKVSSFIIKRTERARINVHWSINEHWNCCKTTFWMSFSLAWDIELERIYFCVTVMIADSSLSGVLHGGSKSILKSCQFK